jgi:hypothetical protein
VTYGVGVYSHSATDVAFGAWIRSCGKFHLRSPRGSRHGLGREIAPEVAQVEKNKLRLLIAGDFRITSLGHRDLNRIWHSWINLGRPQLSWITNLYSKVYVVISISRRLL